MVHELALCSNVTGSWEGPKHHKFTNRVVTFMPSWRLNLIAFWQCCPIYKKWTQKNLIVLLWFGMLRWLARLKLECHLTFIGFGIYLYFWMYISCFCERMSIIETTLKQEARISFMAHRVNPQCDCFIQYILINKSCMRRSYHETTAYN